MSRRNKKHPLRFIVWGLLLIVFFLGIRKYVVPPVYTTLYPPTPTPTVGPNPLEAVVSPPLQGAQGTYSLGIYDLKYNQSYFLNENHVYDTASVYKLWITAVVFQQIEAGKLRIDQELSVPAQTLNQEFDIPESEAEITSGTIDYTVKDALDKMIIISDNYASLLLTHEIGYPSVTAFLKENGLTHSHVGIGDASPQTTVTDLVRFFRRLYGNQILNKQYTADMINLLKQTEFNTVIPKYLPSSVTIAHKTGALDDVSHDAGIIFAPRGNYIMVIMSDSGDPRGAEDRMAHVSEAVYHYFATRVEPTPPPKPQIQLFYPLLGLFSLVGLSVVLFIILRKKREPPPSPLIPRSTAEE